MSGKTYLDSRHSARKYFTDKKVVALCNASKKGDLKKISSTNLYTSTKGLVDRISRGVEQHGQYSNY